MPRKEHIVHVQGTGVAALTCARLLGKQGWTVRLEKAQRSRPTHLLLGRTTANLLSALWDDSELLEEAHPIRERAVRWGSSSECSVLVSPGFVVRTDELIRRLEMQTQLSGHSEDNGIDWKIDARSPRQGVVSSMLNIGHRHAWVAHATLKSGALANRCAMETLEWGWAFLLPVGNGKADLQFVSIPSDAAQPDPELVVARSTMLSSAVAKIDSWREPIASMPRYHPAPARPGSLAVGEAALSFDPISGDGVGHALRGAVLAAITLDDVMHGQSRSACVERYASTLHRAMAHHLEICLKLYGDMMCGEAWRDELDVMRLALARLREADAVPAA